MTFELSKLHSQPSYRITEYGRSFFAKLVNGYQANIYLFKVNKKNSRKWCEICAKVTTKTPQRRQWHCSGVLIVNFEHISNLFLVFYCWLWAGKCWLGKSLTRSQILCWVVKLNTVMIPAESIKRSSNKLKTTTKITARKNTTKSNIGEILSIDFESEIIVNIQTYELDKRREHPTEWSVA